MVKYGQPVKNLNAACHADLLSEPWNSHSLSVGRSRIVQSCADLVLHDCSIAHVMDIHMYT